MLLTPCTHSRTAGQVRQHDGMNLHNAPDRAVCPRETEPGVLVHTPADWELATAHWLLATARHRRAPHMWPPPTPIEEPVSSPLVRPYVLPEDELAHAPEEGL